MALSYRRVQTVVYMMNHVSGCPEWHSEITMFPSQGYALLYWLRTPGIPSTRSCTHHSAGVLPGLQVGPPRPCSPFLTASPPCPSPVHPFSFGVRDQTPTRWLSSAWAATTTWTCSASTTHMCPSVGGKRSLPKWSTRPSTASRFGSPFDPLDQAWKLHRESHGIGRQYRWTIQDQSTQ